MTLATAIVQERIAYGGIAATRLQVYEDVRRRLPDAPSVGIGSADWWAFRSPALTDEQTAGLIPWGIVCLGCRHGNLHQPLPHQDESLCDPCYQKGRTNG